MDRTSIPVKSETADELYRLKGRTQTYDELIRALLSVADEHDPNVDVGIDVGGDGDSPDASPDADTPAPEAGETTPRGGTRKTAAEGTDERADSTPAAPAPDTLDAELDELVDAVADDVLPGSGAKLAARREAFRAVVAHLREHGNATPQEFRDVVYPEYDGRYTEGKNPPRSWWKNAMYPALSELAQRSDSVEKADTSGEWAYRGEP